MFYHDDVNGQMIIGEATLKLLSRSAEVTLSSLIEEFIEMAELEESDDRLSLISDVKFWLMEHLEPGQRYETAKSWIKKPPF